MKLFIDTSIFVDALEKTLKLLSIVNVADLSRETAVEGGRIYAELMKKGEEIEFIYQGEPKGLAHTILVAEDFLDDDFVMYLGDNILKSME